MFFSLNMQFFFNKNNWKLVLIITFRNQRMRKFCKKRLFQLDPIWTIQTENLLDSIKKYYFHRFFPARKLACAPPRARINQKLLYLLVFLILRMKNVHISCSTPPDGVPLVFNLLFLERMKFWRPSFLQNCANRRFRWLMIVENFDKKSKNCRFFFFAYSVRSRRVRRPNGLIFKISSRYSRERTGQSWKSAIFKTSFFTSIGEFFNSFFIYGENTPWSSPGQRKFPENLLKNDEKIFRKIRKNAKNASFKNSHEKPFF